MANRSMYLVKSNQRFTDAQGRAIIVATCANRSKKYPSHGAKRRPIKEDAAPDGGTVLEAVKSTGV